ncbi:MAG: four-helix bundle copper-binding protein [Phycisphaerales bacterium]
MNHEAPSKDTLDCMKACGECATICAQTAHHCLHLGGPHASPEHQGILQDCKQICGLAACFTARNSEHAPHICKECAEICNACADSCEKLAKGDKLMTQCAQVCRKCAQTCEKMAGAAV